MDNRHRNRIRYLITAIIACGVLLLGGCASVIDYSSYVHNYENQYRQLNPYIPHAVKRDRHLLHAREFGQNHSGAPIILMHGFPDSLHLYDRLAPLLAQKHRVISFDFLGWGDSDKPQQHRYDANSLFADLQAVITHFQLKEVVLVGHDASGFPAIDWALAHPHNTKLLVILNSVYSPMQSIISPEAIALFSTPSLMRTIRRWGAYQSDGLWQQGLIEQTSKFYSDEQVKEKYIKIFAYQALSIRPAFFGLNEVLLSEIEKRRHAIPKMKNYRRPVEIIFGADDPYLNTAVANEFDKLFPVSNLTLVARAGHYVQLDRPEIVASKILNALSKTKSTDH